MRTSPRGGSTYSASSCIVRHQLAGKIMPELGRLVRGKQKSCAAWRPRRAQTTFRPGARSAARQRKAAIGELDRFDVRRCGFQFGLAGIWIVCRRDHFADARIAAVASLQWIGAKIEPRCWPAVTATFRIALPCRVVTLAKPPSASFLAFASAGWISTNGSGEWAHRRGLAPVRVIVCHWSRKRPVLSRNG